MKKKSKRARRWATNKRAVIKSTTNSQGTFKTLTKYRDRGTLNVEVSTRDVGRGRTRLFVRSGEGNYIALSGLEARTVYRTLQKHFEATDRVV